MTSINNFAERQLNTASKNPLENSLGWDETPLWFHPELNAGTPDADYLLGTDRKNTLDGGLGADTMEGLRGSDTYVVDNIGDVVLENFRGGTDTILSSISYTLGANVENLTLTGSNAINATGNTAANILIGNAGNNVLDGQRGNDTLIGSQGDTLIGGKGNDYLQASGFATMHGGDGNDTAVIEPGQAALYGKSTWFVGSNVLTAESSKNAIEFSFKFYYPILEKLIWNIPTYTDQSSVIMTGIENLSVINGASSDDLIFSLGNGTVYSGGGGTDTFYADWSQTTEDITWVNDGSAVTVNGAKVSGMERLLITTGSGNDLIDNKKWGDRGDDISTGAGHDTISFFSPGTADGLRDSIHAGAGDDLITGVGYSAYIDGGQGNDTVQINYVNTSLYSNSSWSVAGITLTASNSSSEIKYALQKYSSPSASYSISSDDFYLTGIENLSIKDAGRGNDLVFALGNGTVYGGGEGTDTFYADWSQTTEDITWVNDGFAVTVNGTEISGMERLLITTGSGNDLIDNKNGGYHGDEISTGAGADTLKGSIQTDILNAGQDNDLIFSSLGSDVITTGTGSDTFVIQSKDHGGSQVMDFQSGTDHITISQTGFAVGNGNNTVEAAQTTNGSFSASAELVIFTRDIEDDTISARSAAAAIGQADSSYTTGQRAVFVVDNGVSSLVYAFTSSGNDATVSASELTLLATLQGTASTTVNDYLFTA